MTSFEKVKNLRDVGLTYQAISDVLGISRQRAEQILHNGVSNRVSLGKKIIYPNLLNWSIDNKCNRDEFLRRMGFAVNAGNKQKLHRVLNGDILPRKDYIDKMLQVTGLSYEKMFEVFPNEV